MKKGKKIIVYRLTGSQGKTTLAAALALELDWQIITNDAHSDLAKVVKEDNILMLEPEDKLPSAKDLGNANIIFDPGGFIDPRMIDALKMSDYVIIPVVNLGKRELETARFVASIFEVEQYNKNIILVLNMLEDKGAEAAREGIKALNYPYPVFEVKKTEAFETMLREGIPVSKIVKRGVLFQRWFKPVEGQLNKLINYIQGEK